jgi:hypothetical protein
MKNLIFAALLLVNSVSFSVGFFDTATSKLYKELKLEGKLDYNIFKKGVEGAKKIKDRKKDSILTIIDYTQPSTQKRFFVFDLKNRKVLYNSHVSHGKNSGSLMAVSFANTLNSYKSSLGFYLTDEPYYGRFGYSLRLKGLEPGINSNAYKRSIVVHGADYARPEAIKKWGFLGRTEGCPAIPTEINEDVIETIKEGSIIFIIGNDQSYYEKSKIIS